jgi:SAM-dependent methyltransferase
MNAEHERYYRLGKTYWWFYGKYRLVLNLLQRFCPKELSSHPQILDAGCGPGHFMELLKEYGETAGTDYSLDRLLFCRQEGFENLAQTDLCHIPFHNDKFDLVVSIDTIEHIQNDRQAVRELYRVTKPGGVLAVTVPAFMVLWGSHDVNQGHYKRYRIHEMRAMLEDAGFHVIKATYAELLWFLPLLVIRKTKALKERIAPSRPSDDFLLFPAWINTLLSKVIISESVLVRRFDLPFGVTMVCLAQKPSRSISCKNQR